MVRDFNFMVRKSLTILVPVIDKYQAMNDTANLIIFKFGNENENSKI
jgi:hypothetical protein